MLSGRDILSFERDSVVLRPPYRRLLTNNTIIVIKTINMDGTSIAIMMDVLSWSGNYWSRNKKEENQFLTMNIAAHKQTYIIE